MVKQGEIISLDFNPTKGREQKGYRPAIVISQSKYNEASKMVLLCPITNTIKKQKLRIQLDSRTKTTGDVLCEQVRNMDLTAREFKVVEQAPDEILVEVLEAVRTIIEKE
jgi:mRNA interferase MazF